MFTLSFFFARLTCSFIVDYSGWAHLPQWVMCLRIGLVFFLGANCSSFCQQLLRHNASVSGTLLKFRGHADRHAQQTFINGKPESWEILISHSKCRSRGSGGGYWQGARDAALTSNHPLCWAAANLSICPSVYRMRVLHSSRKGPIAVGVCVGNAVGNIDVGDVCRSVRRICTRCATSLYSGDLGCSVHLMYVGTVSVNKKKSGKSGVVTTGSLSIH